MNLSAPNLDMHLDPEETDYIRPSLHETRDGILCTLDIVEVAQNMFWMSLRKVKKWRREDRTQQSEAYTSDCPRCKKIQGLFIFPGQQSYWCSECNWRGWPWEQGNDIFAFLTHCSPDEFPDTGNFNEDDKRKIQELYRRFPEALSFLAEKNIHRYIYDNEYFQLAERYYPRIEEDLKMAESSFNFYENTLRNHRYPDADFIRWYHASWERLDMLQQIVEAYTVVSKIYSRRAEIDGVLRSESPESIGLTVDDWNIQDADPDTSMSYPPDEEAVDKLPQSSTVWIYYDERDSQGDSLKDDPFFEWIHQRYIEILGTTFLSVVKFPKSNKYCENINNPIVWNFIIAYSQQENNFSLFLSPRSTEKTIDQSGYHWTATQDSVMQFLDSVESGGPFQLRYPPNYQREGCNIPVIPDGYREVATGAYVSTDIGTYFTWSTQEYSSYNPNWPWGPQKSAFDKNLLTACIGGLEGSEKAFLDKIEFAEAYMKEAKRLDLIKRIREAQMQAFSAKASERMLLIQLWALW